MKWQHKKAKAERKSAGDLKNLLILPENSAEGFMSRRERCWVYVSMRIHPKRCHIFPLKVATTVVQRRVQLEHSSQIVRVGVEATC